MSIYKTAITRFVLPIFNKSLRHKNITSWNVKCNKLQTANNKHYSYANSVNLRNQFRFIHLSSATNKIISFNLSDIGEGIREVVVKEWFIKEGDKVSQFDNICEVQSDKASVTITSRYDGVITKLYYSIEDIALVGKPLVDIDTPEPEDALVQSNADKKQTEDEEIKKPNSQIEMIKNPTEATEKSFRGFAIPSVRRLAKEHNINLTLVKGTGKDARILKEDILNYINMKSQSNIDTNDVNIEPVKGYTRVMIKTMTEAIKIPHFVYHDEIVVSNLVKLREKLKKTSTNIDVKITYLPFFIKATSNALSRYPILNAKLDDSKENIIYFKSHNIGVAMDTPTGLVVPVIKNVQNMDIIQISKELNRLQNLGNQSKFLKNDLSDGTFSFSNIGSIGGTYAKPIILPPQSAIIALGAFQAVPRFSEDDTIIREIITYFSGAGDHRIIDGATMARFCNVLKEQIQNPELLFLNL